MNIQELHEQVIALIKQGQFTKGIEDYYAEDVIQRDNDGAVRQGRDQLAEAEREYESKVTSLDNVEILATAIDDQGSGSGTVFYECQMQWQHEEAGRVNVAQVVIEQWNKSKIQEVRFYGTFESENA